MDNNNEDLDLLEFLKYTLDCMYISDLRIEPYNKKAKLLLKKMNLSEYPKSQIDDAFQYIMNKIK